MRAEISKLQQELRDKEKLLKTREQQIGSLQKSITTGFSELVNLREDTSSEASPVRSEVWYCMHVRMLARMCACTQLRV